MNKLRLHAAQIETSLQMKDTADDKINLTADALQVEAKHAGSI